jgi:hypothetical protein
MTVRKFFTGVLVFLIMTEGQVWAGASSDKPDTSSGAQKKPEAPIWVLDKETAFPNKDWVREVGTGPDRNSAEANALSELAQVFRVDLNSVSHAEQQLSQITSAANSRQNPALSSEARSFSQDVVSTSKVSGLIGLEMEFFDGAADGKAYANARMNRRDCAKRYSALIVQSESLIAGLKKDAEARDATFEALSDLRLAQSLALVADNYQSILEVLDVDASGKKPSYGSADEVKKLADKVQEKIIIIVKVSGDPSGRIRKAFEKVFTTRNYRVTGNDGEGYHLNVDFSLQKTDIDDARGNIYVRYLIKAELKDKNDVELVAYSENRREGHKTESEASNRALTAAENSITVSDGGFAKSFDEFTSSAPAGQ